MEAEITSCGSRQIKPAKVGLALGSGGVRGAAHFGVIRTLLKHGVKIACVAGSSSGSVIGAALAAGKLDAMEKFFRSATWWRMFRLLFEINWFKSGLLTGRNIKRELRRIFGDITFEQCPIPFTAVAIDMMNGQEVPIRTGDLVDGTYASMAIPGLFRPVPRDGRWIADGGLANPLPVQACRNMGADFVIAVDVNLGQPLDTPQRPDRMPGLWTIFTQTCRIIENNWTDRILRQHPPDVLLQPSVGDILAARFRHVARAILRGKHAAERMLSALSPENRIRLGLAPA